LKYFKVYKDDYFRNIFLLITGTALAQFIPILFSPIISRLYSPSDFGVLALFTSFVTLFTQLGTGMYESAILLPKENKDAMSIVVICFLITICLSILTLILFHFLHEYITSWTGIRQLGLWLYLVPVLVFLSSTYNTLNNWNNRLKNFSFLAKNKIIQATSTVLTKIIMGLYDTKAGGLILSTILGQSLAVFLLGSKRSNFNSEDFRQIKIASLKKNARDYSDFPKFVLPQGFIDGLRESAISILIIKFYGEIILGLFAFTISILNKPLQVIGNSISQVFYQKAAELYNTDKRMISSITQKTIRPLIYMSLAIFIILVLTGPKLFSFTFGNDWKDAGMYAIYMSPWILLKLITSPITAIPAIYSKQKKFLYFGIVNNFSIPLALFLGGIFSLNFRLTLVIMTLTGMINLLSQQIWITSLTKKAG